MAFRYSSLRPPTRAGDLQRWCNDYFRKCDESGTAYSKSGLALHISAPVPALEDWSKLPEFEAILAEAFTRIEASYVDRLVTSEKPTNGLQFVMDNQFGWKQKREVELGEKTREAVTQALPLADKMKIIQSMGASLQATQAKMLEIEQEVKRRASIQGVVVDAEYTDVEDAETDEEAEYEAEEREQA